MFIYHIYIYIYVYIQVYVLRIYHRSIIFYVGQICVLRRVCSGNPAATTAATFGLHPVRSSFVFFRVFHVDSGWFLCAPCFRLVPLGSGSLATWRKSTALHVNQMHMLCTCSCQCYCLTCLMVCQFCHILRIFATMFVSQP